jgi:hypothetical protein
MNTEDLEKDLRDRMAAAGLQQRDPTAAWKQDILRQARVARERGDAGVPAAPRWLLIALGAAWCLIVMLRVTTPASGAHALVTTVAPEEAKNPVTSTSTDDLPLTALGALLAINAQNQPSEVP